MDEMHKFIGVTKEFYDTDPRLESVRKKEKDNYKAKEVTVKELSMKYLNA